MKYLDYAVIKYSANIVPIVVKPNGLMAKSSNKHLLSFLVESKAYVSTHHTN